ncbi:hypothetical protein ACR6HW_12160 [Fusibacter sp. JL298sf-3]
MDPMSKHIYLVFTRTGTWLARTISIFSETKYVHTSISFDSSFKEMYSFGRKNPNNPFSGGFVRENLYEGVFKKWGKSECIIFKVEVSAKQFDGLKRDVEYFYRNQHRYGYNFIGLFGVLINRPIKRKNHYFCTQFVYELLYKHRLVDLEKHPGLITTLDLLDIGGETILYEGFISNMTPVLERFQA